LQQKCDLFSSATRNCMFRISAMVWRAHATETRLLFYSNDELYLSPYTFGTASFPKRCWASTSSAALASIPISPPTPNSTAPSTSPSPPSFLVHWRRGSDNVADYFTKQQQKRATETRFVFYSNDELYHVVSGLSRNEAFYL
jgi:hypothetical protein